ncbi:MAG: (deoxy)nucleoside triphosphate pyrophosphohydrolase [Pyrinomonadaceae bacterium]
MEKILVAAAVIERGGRVLLCRRPRGKRHGGLWEFPGGKLDGDETLADALRRELREELGVELTASGATLFTSHDRGSPFEIHFVEASIAGEPVPIEHEALAWVAVADCDKYALAPSDLEFVIHHARGRIVS